MNQEDINSREQRARQLHQQGYNCCQSVVLAFEDLLPINAEQALALSAPFGRGLSGLREVCGCVSGMAIVCGLTNHSSEVKSLAEMFRSEHGDVNCGRLLQQGPQRHSCNDLVASAARLLAQIL